MHPSPTPTLGCVSITRDSRCRTRFGIELPRGGCRTGDVTELSHGGCRAGAGQSCLCHQPLSSNMAPTAIGMPPGSSPHGSTLPVPLCEVASSTLSLQSRQHKMTAAKLVSPPPFNSTVPRLPRVRGCDIIRHVRTRDKTISKRTQFNLIYCTQQLESYPRGASSPRWR